MDHHVRDRSFTLAHLSDPHLPLSDELVPTARELVGKRLLAFLSWQRKRKRSHGGDRLQALLHDIAARAPDAVALTGDLVNLALPREFRAARRWLESLEAPERVFLVPGNHDVLVRVPDEQGLEQWHPWLRGDDGSRRFPTVRRLGPVALVGLCTAVPTPPLLAGGRMGREQLRRTATLLRTLGEEGRFRIVLLHHPPVDAGGHRIALWDAAALRAILRDAGAELVLHGHRHLARFNTLPGPLGAIPVVGVPSASHGGSGAHGGRWNSYRITPYGDGWHLRLESRGWDGAGIRSLGGWFLRIPRPRPWTTLGTRSQSADIPALATLLQ